MDEPTRNPFNIYTYDARTALAFQIDCENFLEQFSQTKSFKFSDFAQIWRSSTFSAIFQDQQYILMLQTFMENSYFIVKKFMFFSDVHIQVGAVYLLYSLYYKQPVRQWVKIRLTQPEADKLKQIVQLLKTQKVYDPLFIYTKMRLDNAFIYCALVQDLGIDERFTKRYNLSSEEIFNTINVECPLKKFKAFIEEDPVLKQLEETDEKYQELMKKYQAKCPNLAPFRSTISQDLKETYNQVFNLSKEETVEEETPLKKLRKKVMKQDSATYRGDKKVVTAIELNPD